MDKSHQAERHDFYINANTTSHWYSSISVVLGRLRSISRQSHELQVYSCAICSKYTLLDMFDIESRIKSYLWYPEECQVCKQSVDDLFTRRSNIVDEAPCVNNLERIRDHDTNLQPFCVRLTFTVCEWPTNLEVNFQTRVDTYMRARHSRFLLEIYRYDWHVDRKSNRFTSTHYILYNT